MSGTTATHFNSDLQLQARHFPQRPGRYSERGERQEEGECHPVKCCEHQAQRGPTREWLAHKTQAATDTEISGFFYMIWSLLEAQKKMPVPASARCPRARSRWQWLSRWMFGYSPFPAVTPAPHPTSAVTVLRGKLSFGCHTRMQ